MVAVAGGVEDRDAADGDAATQLVEGFRVPGELVAVAPAKLLETLGTVVRPRAQRVAGRQIAGPRVQPGALAGDPARPDMVDQDAMAVRAVEAVVDPPSLARRAPPRLTAQQPRSCRPVRVGRRVGVDARQRGKRLRDLSLAPGVVEVFGRAMREHG